MADESNFSRREIILKCKVCDATESLKRCSRCQKTFYCSRQHQMTDWNSHKAECSGKEVMLQSNPNFSQQQDTDTGDSSKSKQILVNSKQTVTNDYNINYNTNELRLIDETKNKKDIDAAELELEADRFDSQPLKLLKGNKLIENDPEKSVKHLYDTLMKDNICVYDDVLELNLAKGILEEVQCIRELGITKDGMLAGGRSSCDNNKKVIESRIRNDKITWLEETDVDKKLYPNITKFIDFIDGMMSDVNSHFNGKPMILGRTKPMIACYPGNGSGYTRHVDNPSKDGRVLTCIYYLNKDWDCEKNGGNLRVFKNDDYNDISPDFNRMIVFWSDSRNPHEVQPAFEQRYAITTWYFDEAERMVAVEENQINAEVDKMANEIAMIEVKRTEQEKKIIETKIEKTSKLAVLGLSDDELESISVLIGTSKDPKHVLGEMGIASSIQDILIDTLKLKGFLK